MRRAARTDGNHAAIVEALRASGWYVHDTSRLGHGFPDLVVARNGQLRLVEIKDGAKPPSKRTLTPEEVAVALAFQLQSVQIHILSSINEALTFT